MQIGDVIKLRQPFQPEPFHWQAYQYGVVVGLVRDDERRHPSKGPLGASTTVLEVVVHLYDLSRAEIFRDGAGIKPLYSFYADEVDGVVGVANF